MAASIDYASDAGPVVRRMSSRRLMAYVGCLLLTLAYLAGPVIAGAKAYGDRRGPVIYPEELHRLLNSLSWKRPGIRVSRASASMRRRDRGFMGYEPGECGGMSRSFPVFPPKQRNHQPYA